jgi:hypothetical protein
MIEPQLIQLNILNQIIFLVHTVILEIVLKKIMKT